MAAGSCTEAPEKPEPDWSSSGTALEIHFEVKPGKQAFQKLAGIWTHSTPAQQEKGRKEIFERLGRKKTVRSSKTEGDQEP